MRSRRGFTFIEILCVVAVVALCIVLVRVVYDYRDDSIKINMAREELSLLNCAIELYKTKNGDYPICESKSVYDSAKKLYSDLSRTSLLSQDHKWMIKDGVLLDPWNNPYVYKCYLPGSTFFVLMSMGPNGHIDEIELIDDIYSR